jgi:hypothetical protein
MLENHSSNRSPRQQQNHSNSPVSQPVFGINKLRSDEMPYFGAKYPVRQPLCNYCATKNATVFRTVVESQQARDLTYRSRDKPRETGKF